MISSIIIYDFYVLHIVHNAAQYDSNIAIKISVTLFLFIQEISLKIKIENFSTVLGYDNSAEKAGD